MTLKKRILKYWFVFAAITSFGVILFMNNVAIDKPNTLLLSIADVVLSLLIFIIFKKGYDRVRSQNKIK